MNLLRRRIPSYAGQVARVDEATLICGCRLFRPFACADDAVALKYCPAHAAFDESLRSLPPNQTNETNQTEQP